MTERPTPERPIDRRLPVEEIRQWRDWGGNHTWMMQAIRDALAHIDHLQAQLDQRSAGFSEWLAGPGQFLLPAFPDASLVERHLQKCWQAAIASQQPVREALVTCVAALADLELVVGYVKGPTQLREHTAAVLAQARAALSHDPRR